MKKHHVKCSLGHRLFDVIEGSNLKIKIKCGNKKACPHKTECMREIEVLYGNYKNELGETYKNCTCPACSKRLFDATKDSVGIVQIKCEHCGKIVDLSLGISA